MEYTMERIDRPWGRMWKLFASRRLWVKVIRVNPGQRTSLQLHVRRKEIHIGLDRLYCRTIPRYRIHRLNAGLYLELAWGRPHECDIVRYADDYGRAKWNERD